MGDLVDESLALIGWTPAVSNAYATLDGSDDLQTLTAVVRADDTAGQLLLTVHYRSFADGEYAEDWTIETGLENGEITPFGMLYSTPGSDRPMLFLVKATGVVIVQVEDASVTADTSIDSLKDLLLHLGSSVDTAGLEDVASDGPFEAIPFSGETWQFSVSEGPNPPTDTYKVCYTFIAPGVQTEASGLGASGCGNAWTSDPDHYTDSYLVSVGPAIEIVGGIVLLVDLSPNPVANVRIVRSSGEVTDVIPFRTPGSGKQFAVVELPHDAAPIRVELVDETGTVLDSSGPVNWDAENPSAAPEAPPLTLHVSNQSFSDPSVGITIEIDGMLVVNDAFDVGSQHNWIEFQFDLAPGDHEIIARSDTGALFKGTVRILDGESVYAVLDYWGQEDLSENGDATPGFEYQVSTEPIYFR